MNRDQGAARRGPEPLARLRSPASCQRRHAQRYIDELSRHRADLEPDDLRQGAERGRRLRRADLGAARGRQERRGALLRARDHRPARRLRPVRARSTGAPTASTAGPRSRSRRCSPTTPRRTAAEAAKLHAAAEPRQPLHQDPGHAGGAAGDRGHDRRRDPGQRDAAVRRRPVRGPGRGLHARASSAASSRGSTRTWARSPRCSSAAGTSPSPARSPTSSPTGSGRAPRPRATSPTAELIESDRWLRLENEGARPQRLLFASTATKDPALPKTKYVDALAAPLTRQHDARGDRCSPSPSTSDTGPMLPADGGDVDALLAEFERRRRRPRRRSPRELQDEGAEKFVDSWKDLLERIEEKSKAVAAG